MKISTTNLFLTIFLFSLNYAYANTTYLNLSDFAIENADNLRSKIESCTVSQRLTQIQNNAESIESYRSILEVSLEKAEKLEKEIHQLLKQSEKTKATAESLAFKSAITMTVIGFWITGSPGSATPLILLDALTKDADLNITHPKVNESLPEEILKDLTSKKCDLYPMLMEVMSLRQNIVSYFNQNNHSFRNSISFGTREFILVEALYRITLAEKAVLKLQLNQVK